MAHPEYIIPGVHATAAHACEEASELATALAKLLRFGPHSVNPSLPLEQQETNLAWVIREFKDLVDAMERFRDAIAADNTPHVQFTPIGA